jgi:hypothetical protein
MKLNPNRLARGLLALKPSATKQATIRFRGGRRLQVIAATALALLAISSLGSCGTPRCTVNGCGFDSNF